MFDRIPNLPLMKANYALKVLFFSVTINFDNERTVKKGRKETIELSTSNTAEKLSVFEVFLERIFPHFGLNTERYSLSRRIQYKCEKCGPEKLQITHFSRCLKRFVLSKKSLQIL